MTLIVLQSIPPDNANAELCIRRLEAVEHVRAGSFPAMGRRALPIIVLDGHGPSSTISRAAFPVRSRRAQGTEAKATGRRAPVCTGVRRRAAVIANARGTFPGAEAPSMARAWIRRPPAAKRPLHGPFSGSWPSSMTHKACFMASAVEPVLSSCLDGSRPPIPPHGCSIRLLAV
jgi:hypothetical protein